MKLKAQNLRSKTRRIYRKSLNILLLSFCALFLLTHHLQALENTKLNAKAKLTIGYDDNVSDRVKDVIKSRFFQLYLNSSIITIPAKRTLFSLKLQDGLKYNDAESLHESILINNLNLNLSRSISRFVPELSGEVRSRKSILSKGEASSSEVSYLRGYTGLALKTIIFSDLSGRLFYNYRVSNFDDFDPFDRRGHELGVKTDVRLLSNSLIILQYSHEMMNFNKWDKGKTSRNDTTDIVTAGIETYDDLLLNVNLSYEDNRSSVDNYSYSGFTLSAMLAKSLPYNVLIEIYGLFRMRNSSISSAESVSEQMAIEDEEKGMIMAKVSKDLTERCALEAQYDIRQSRSGKDFGTYTKNVFTLSIDYGF
ncbi:MAG: hypothetical protein QG588_2079 [Candidatus Poribacteria bacterium]|nr:hypothetical protein [Candidatus Poribacteria bacterium]